MGGNCGDFYASSMFDYQNLYTAWCMTNGIKIPDESDIVSVSDLDALYASMKKPE